jgi:hypothetical protein
MSRRLATGTALLALALFASLHAQRPTSATVAFAQSAPAAKAFPLTVDSIMRGPDLVGSAPTAVRWSGDSRQIYFSWQKPGEDEASTYVVPREGGEPRKLSKEEEKQAPPANGRWNSARTQMLATDGGDIVIYDRATGARRQITKTDGAEGSARWAKNDTAITFVQGGNLYLLQLAPGAGDTALLTQLTDISAARPDPPLSASQRLLREEEEKLLDIVRQRAEARRKTEEERKADALPKLEINARQRANDIQLSPDGRYAWVSVTEQPAQAGRRADVPNYITDSAYAEMIPTRTNVGDAQQSGRLAIIDLQAKTSVWADASFVPPAKEGEKTPRPASWTMPEISADGKFAVAAVRSEDNKDRWLVVVDPANGKARVLNRLTDEAWVRNSGVVGRDGAFSFGGSGVAFLNDHRRAAFLSERDGWMHLYTVDVSADSAEPVQLTTGQWEIENARLSADGT